MTRSAVAFAVAALALSADAAPVPVYSGLTPPARQVADPLPAGAVTRLGSNRFLVPGGVDRLIACDRRRGATGQLLQFDQPGILHAAIIMRR